MRTDTHAPLDDNLVIDRARLAVLHARARRARSEFVNSLVARLVRRLAPRSTAADLFARIA